MPRPGEMDPPGPHPESLLLGHAEVVEAAPVAGACAGAHADRARSGRAIETADGLVEPGVRIRGPARGETRARARSLAGLLLGPLHRDANRDPGSPPALALVVEPVGQAVTDLQPPVGVPDAVPVAL